MAPGVPPWHPGSSERRRRALAGRYEVTALNRRPIPGARVPLADIADLEAIRPAFATTDVVVHLAGASRSTEPWATIRDGNLVGAYNVYEAAREAGVARAIFASASRRASGRSGAACATRCRAPSARLPQPSELRYAVVHIVSDNRVGYRDLAEARRVLGYVPLDRAEDHRQEERA